MPVYTDRVKLDSVIKELSSMPPLIFAGETRSLKSQIYQVQKGESFYLQGGDCAESFKELNPNLWTHLFTTLSLVKLSLSRVAL